MYQVLNFRAGGQVYGVTDHGTFLGHVEEAATPGTPYYEAPSSAPVNDINSPENLNISTASDRILLKF